VDTAAQALATAIGGRVRDERLARRWTLDQLAVSAGVSRRMLVSVEQGAVNASVGTLLRLSEALGVGLPALVEPPRTEQMTVTRASDGAALWSGAAGGRGVLVAGTTAPDVVELWDWTLAPGDRRDSEAHVTGTRELVQVVTGVVVVEAGTHSVTLKPGDAVAFRGDVPHAYAHQSGEPARFSLVVFEPGVGTRHGTPSGGPE
jgi:transcriptional regulator with XRE-family HTH domain